MLGVMARGRCWRGGGRAAAGATRARWREHKVVKWCTPLCLSRVARALFGLRFASLFAQRCAVSVGARVRWSFVLFRMSFSFYVFPAHAGTTRAQLFKAPHDNPHPTKTTPLLAQFFLHTLILEYRDVRISLPVPRSRPSIFRFISHV